jgi:outer membrane receptor protein involved in Fe transport
MTRPHRPEIYGPYSTIPAYIYNDLTVQYRPADAYALTFGVKNISDVARPGPAKAMSIPWPSPDWLQRW